MSKSEAGKCGLVVVAHTGDFVWRAGGAIALYAKRGWQMKIVCLSFGERGESAKMWREPGITLDKVKSARRAEAEKAAKILGGEIEFYDLGDYPLRVDDKAFDRLVDVYRKLKPQFVLTHSREDPYNFDHPYATRIAQEARIIAQAHGHKPGEGVLGAPPVYLFEPHQPEQCNWKPDMILDISEVFDQKRKAFECLEAQEYLWDYYTRVALNRGVQGARNSERKQMKYGEAYQRIFPTVAEEFV
jgi:4-oxalomesaconate hydratase